MKFLLVLLSLCSLAMAADVPSLHNMIVFGTEQIYVSHLPMYEHNVHRYQAIYEVTFGEKDDQKYRDKKASLKAKFFGISPQQKFTMPSLGKGSKFRAGLHPGHPEATESIGTLDVEVVRVVHFHPLLPEGGERPKVLTYFKAGSGPDGEVYLAHLLTTPTQGFESPADQFDQIVRVKRAIAPVTLDKVEISNGATVTISTQDTASRRLTETPDSKHFTRAEISSESGTVTALLHIAAEEYLHTEGDVRVGR
jgi:hypothetical protein